jgi:hypothetical protein
MHLTLNSLSENSRERWIQIEQERYHEGKTIIFVFCFWLLRERKIYQTQQEVM